MIGQKDEKAPGFLVEVTHLAQEHRECLPALGQSRPADVVAAHPCGTIQRPGMLPGEAQVVLGSDDKEVSGPRDQVEAFEIHVRAIHHRESSGVENEIVEPEHVVRTSAGDVNAGGNRAAQIDLDICNLIPALVRRKSAQGTRGDVAQSFAPRKLGKGHANNLLPTAEMPDPAFRIVAFDQAVESLEVDQIEKAGQHKSAGIHAKKHEQNSNASHPFSAVTHSFYGYSKTSSFS